MSVSSLVQCIAVLIFQLWGVQTHSPTAACPAPCLCEKTSLVNCTSLGLSKAPSRIPATATALDLSHNALRSLVPFGSGRMHLRGLQHFWVGNNSLESLSMCFGKGVKGTRTLPKRKERCVSWAPDLQILSAEGNQLKCLPRGLGNITSLKVLQLSHNRISEIGPADLAGCTHLRELHLQHNLINTIHPQAFKDLQKLQVLDLSYNLLTIIPVPTYLSLRTINALVDISGNRWKCDCNLKTIRRWLSFDSELGDPAWKVVCFSPHHHAGKHLLYLGESDLTCPQPVYNTPGIKKEVTVDEGMELILSCSTANQDFMQSHWWTPHGQISDSQQFLLISNITEQHAGLYVCVSGFQEEQVLVFNLHVQKRRLRREAQISLDELVREDNVNMQRNVPALRQVPQSQFALAVCLSVFITFIVAFVLGIILRPLLDKLCKQIRTKKNSTSPSNSRTSSTGPRPYMNEGYSDTDDQVQEVQEGVTFGGVTEIQEKGGVPYYVTIEDTKSDSSSGTNMDVAVLHENVQKNESGAHCLEVHNEVPRREENKKMSDLGSTKHPNAESIKVMKFEYIPDPEDTTEIEEKRISSASSLSGERQEPQLSYEVRESIEQSVDSPTVSIHEDEQASTDHEATIPGFITDPFSWRMSELRKENVDELDPDLWNDSGESFSFTESSPRSNSRVSQVAALDYTLFEKEMSVDKQSDRPSSCNSTESGESEGEPTEYTVNPEDDEDPETHVSYSENDDINYSENRLPTLEENILTEEKNTGTGDLFRQATITLDPSDIHMTYPRGDSFDDGQFTERKENSDPSNISSDYEDEPAQYHVHPVYRASQKTTSLLVADTLGTSSCSEDEDKQENYPRRLEIKLEHEVNSLNAIPVKSPDRVLNINYDNSSSSTDIEDKSSKEKSRGKLKGLSGLSALLFNRRGAETDKAALQTAHKTATTNSGGTVGFLGLSFKKQPVTPAVKPTIDEDNFFVTIGQVFDLLPKLKKSLLFSISNPQPPIQQGSTSVMERIFESERSHVSPSTKSHFFGKVDQTSDPIPQVKRYLQFSQSRSHPTNQAPSLSSAIEKIIPNVDVKTESMKCSSSSEDEVNATTKGDDFFGQIGASFDDLPKVKRYVQFSPSKSHTSNHSTPPTSIKPVGMPKVVSKTESRKSKPSSDTITKIDIFFEGRRRSLDAIPKVQRYVRFTQAEPQTVHELSPTIKGDSFFGLISLSFDGVPKVNRHIQFTQSESHSLKNDPITDAQIESKKSTLASENHAKSINVGDNFLGQMDTSFDQLPKVKRYVHVTEFAHYPPTQTSSFSDTLGVIPVLTTKVERRCSLSSEDDKQTTKGGSFFGQIAASLDGVPKVKRSIQFTQSELCSETLSSYLPLNKTEPTMQEGTEIKRNISSSKDCNPIADEHNFFGQIGVSLDEIPKLRRCIQFTAPQPPSLSLHRPIAQPEFSPDHFKTNKDNFFGKTDASLCEVPKVKRYLQFTQDKFHHSAPSKSLNTHGVTFDEVTKTEFGRSSMPEVDVKPSITTEVFEGEIGTSFNSPPKIKRYIWFKQFEPYSSCQSQPPSLLKQAVTPVMTKGSSSSSDEKSSTSKNNFLEGIRASLDNIPKLKRSLQFTPSEAQPSNHSSPYLNTEIIATELATNIQSSSSSDKDVKQNNQDNFFEQIITSLNGVPKVKGYIQFSQSEVYPPTPSSVKIKGVTITESRRSSGSSENTIKPASRREHFFESVDMSVDRMQKLKRYLKFTHSQISAQSPSPSFKTKTVTPELATKRDSGPSFEKERRTIVKDDTFFGQKHTSFDELPKVKRYIQFIKSEPQLSAQSLSTSAITECVTPELQTKMLSKSSEDEISSSTKEDHFFGQIGTSCDGMPKVKRYIQFIQSEPPSQQPLLYPSPNRTEKTIHAITELKRHNLASEDYIQPVAEQHNLLGQMKAFSGIPKVRGYIQFTQCSTQPLSPSFHRQIGTPEFLTKPELLRSSSSADDSKANDEDTFFKKMDASLCEIPKVKRYIQFTQCETYHSAPSKSLNTHAVTFDVATKTELRRPNLPEVDVKPSITEDNFPGQIRTGLNALPRVNRYIEFTQSKPYSPSQLQSPEKITKKEWKRLSSSIDNDAKSSTSKDTFFHGICASLDNIPKVKKALRFTQSEHQPSNQTVFSEKVTPWLVTKTESAGLRSSSDKEVQSNNQDSFLGQIATSLDGVPKVKKYIQFSQSEVYSTTRPSSVNFQGVMITESRRSSSSYKDDKPVSKGNNNFESAGASVNSMPNLKRYLKFTHPHILAQSPSPSLKAERIPPELGTKTGSKWTGSSSEEKLSIVTKVESFIGQIDTPLGGVPKVKRYIQFTQYEPHSQTPSPYHPSNKTDATADSQTESTKSSLAPAIDAKSINIGENLSGSLDVHFDQLPKVKRHVRIMQSEPYRSTQVPSRLLNTTKLERVQGFPSEDQLKLATKENDLFGQIDVSLNGVPKVTRYIQFRQSEPHIQTMSPSTSSPMWETMDAGRESRTFEENATPTTIGGDALGKIIISFDGLQRLEKSLSFTKSDPHDQNQAQSGSLIQDASSAVNVTSRLNQLPRPKRSLFFSNPDAYVQSDQLLTPIEGGFRQTNSNSSSGDKKDTKTQNSSSKTGLSTPDSETILESKLPSLGASASQTLFPDSDDFTLANLPMAKRSQQSSTSKGISESISDPLLQPRKRLVMDIALQDVSQSIIDAPSASLEKDDAREYLRDSSLARQRQERRRLLFQQKRRAMDGLSLTSQSFTSQDGDQQGSLSGHYGARSSSYS